MIAGVFSDVHGNFEALEAALAAMAKDGAQRFWCLGDVVGYGADPNACTARIREIAECTVLGNHDAACVGAEGTENFNAVAREAAEWTRRHLTPENQEWLMRLPLVREIENVVLVHASPFEPEQWRYVHGRLREADVRREFGATTTQCTFIGHSHQPLVLARRSEEVLRVAGDSIRLEPEVRYLVNVGSTGQPRDGDPRAAYVLYDTEARAVTLRRVAYDVAAARNKILRAGLPAVLAERLETGT